jgi:hypothetical protein
MNGLLFLTGEDFSVRDGTKGTILCHNIKGFSLILFYSTNCEHCTTFIPIFKELPGTINGCQFGMANALLKSRGRDGNKVTIVNMAKDTIAPIQYVPYVVLYIDGKPFMRYNGPQNAGEIMRFIVEVSKKVATKEQFSKDVVKTTDRGIPSYCLGKPLYGCEHGVCYLPQDEAYTPLKN